MDEQHVGPQQAVVVEQLDAVDDVRRGAGGRHGARPHLRGDRHAELARRLPLALADVERVVLRPARCNAQRQQAIATVEILSLHAGDVVERQRLVRLGVA